jgi:integrase
MPPVATPRLEPHTLTSAPAPRTLAELEQRIEVAPSLDARARRDLLSAIASAGRILRQPLANTPCDIAWFNAHLFERPPSAHRIGDLAFKSIISRLRRALRLVDLHAPHVAGEDGLPPDWQVFLAAIPIEPLRVGLRRLARYAASRALAPQEVTDSALAAFLEHDAATRLGASVLTQGAELAHAWNRAASFQTDPARFARLSAPKRRQAYTLPIYALSVSFQADLDAFVLRFVPLTRRDTHHIDPDAPLRVTLSPVEGPWSPRTAPEGRRPHRRVKPWRHATRDSRVFSIRQAVAALVHTGTPIEEITDLAVLVQPRDNAHRILSYYLDRADGAPGSQREQVGKVLLLIARYHVPVPDEDVEVLAGWLKEVSAPAQFEMGTKARTALRQLAAPRARAILLALPEHLARTARDETLAPIERARFLRAAVIIELLLRCPMRLSNLRGLRLDRHLQYLDGPRRPSHLTIDGREVKNGERLDFPIPREAGDLIQMYLRDARPLLAEPGNQYLFPGLGAAPLSTDQLRVEFKSKVEGATGVAAYPHLMRAFAGLLFLEQNPGQYELLRRILGHKQVETTIRYYTGLERELAFKLSDAALLRQRSATRAMAAAALGKPRRRRS